MAQVPLPRHPQVGFPTGAGAIDQSPDDVLTEELDEVGSDPAFQVQCGTVFQVTTLARLTHGAAFHQHEDGGAVACW